MRSQLVYLFRLAERYQWRDAELGVWSSVSFYACCDVLGKEGG
jgi:hypothetical protein